LDIASSSNILVDLVDAVGITDHADLWFVSEKSLHVSIEVGISKVVVKHSNWQLQIRVLVLLVGTVFSKAGEKTEVEDIQREGTRWRNAT
jgi:hypothetical protein